MEVRFLCYLHSPNLLFTIGFTVNPEAQTYFDSLRDNNLGVITIVGKNRTGKSYLLNRVILNQNSGFSVGHTVNPCTKVSIFFVDLKGLMILYREYGFGHISLKWKITIIKLKN